MWANRFSIAVWGANSVRFDPERLHRRSIRLKGYDYSQPGAYFITICTQDRACLFGEVVDGEMRLNDAGQMVQDVWDELPAFYPGVQTDAFIVMPNHIHGIIILVGAGSHACPDEIGQPQGVAPTRLSLPDVVHRFKTMTTKRYIDGVKKFGWTPFRRRLWQCNYYEHIIRNDHALQRFREYIWTNPLRWHLDRENPNRSRFGRI
jgi:REP element-mobilizing transposase RayT